MNACVLKGLLTLGLLLLLAPLCYARDCRMKTANAPLHAVVSSGSCVQVAEVKVCAPAGKKPSSSSIKELKASSNIEVEDEIKHLDDSCIVAKVTVRARNVMGPPIWQYCAEGSYDGLAELGYCQ